MGLTLKARRLLGAGCDATGEIVEWIADATVAHLGKRPRRSIETGAVYELFKRR